MLIFIKCDVYLELKSKGLSICRLINWPKLIISAWGQHFRLVYGPRADIIGLGQFISLQMDSPKQFFQLFHEISNWEKLLLQSCNCNPEGSVNQNCDVQFGNCTCKPNVVGKKCNQCSSKHYGFSAQGCQASIQQKDICPKTSNELSTHQFLALSNFSPATATLKAP